MRSMKMLAMAMALASLAAGSAAAQDWRHGWDRGSQGWGGDHESIRFDPGAITLSPGQVGHFHVRLTQRGEVRSSRPQDFRVSAWPNGGVRIGVAGDGFNISADQPGSYRVTAEYSSRRFGRDTRAEMIVNVTSPARRDVVERIGIFEAHTQQPLDGQIQVLSPGAQLHLRARGFDHCGQPLRVSPAWELSSPAAGQVADLGRDEIALVAGNTVCGHTVHTLVARVGRVTASLQFRVMGPAPVAVLDHIDLVSVLPSGETRPLAGVIYAARGSQLTLRAIGHTARGQAIGFEEQWSLSTSQLGQLQRGAQGSMVLILGRHYRGTIVLVVRDRATGVAAQVQVVVN